MAFSVIMKTEQNLIFILGNLLHSFVGNVQNSSIAELISSTFGIHNGKKHSCGEIKEFKHAMTIHFTLL